MWWKQKENQNWKWSLKNVMEWLQCHDKLLIGEEFLLMDGQRKWFLQMTTTLDEDTVKIVEMTTKDLEYYINLAKQQQDLRELTPVFKEVLSKMLPNIIECYRESVMTGRVN